MDSADRLRCLASRQCAGAQGCENRDRGRLSLIDTAAGHGRRPAQVALRWQVQSGPVAIPESVAPSRIIENLDVFGFALTEEDMAKIATLDNNRGPIGPDPDLFS